MNKPSMIALAGGGILVALLLGAFLVATGNGASATKSDAAISSSARISTTEANAWAEARAADTDAAYRTYLAAYPQGAFNAEANQSIGRLAAVAEAEKQAEEQKAAEKAAAAEQRARTVRVAERGPSRAQIREACGQWVNRQLSPPSKTTRAVTGAAAGCAVGALAGGNDTRNCAIGAVAGGATGYVTAGNRERKREQLYQSCLARGGPG